MRLKQYQIDAFTTRLFQGNPAAVCPLERWLPDNLLKAVAAENNLSETAFFVPQGKGFHLRWFTPVAEVDLCGHATLAAAFVLFDIFGYPQQTLTFYTRSGELRVKKGEGYFEMDFPAQPLQSCSAPPALIKGLGKEPLEVLCGEDYVAVFKTEADIRALVPNPLELEKLALRGVAVTSKGDTADFVSRFFAPKSGISEDPVTGSAHCALAPYWQGKLGKSRFVARQLSQRGGEVGCTVEGERVFLRSSAVKFMQGEIFIPASP